MQLEKDSFIQRNALAKKYQEKGNQDLFQLTKAAIDSKGKEEGKKEGHSGKSKGFQPIKDIQEYEFFQRQKQYFYSGHLSEESKAALNLDEQKKLNSVMRVINFAVGSITEEEFYNQECLEEELEEKVAGGQRSASGTRMTGHGVQSR